MALKSALWNLSLVRSYFLRGHNNWFAYVMSLLNFITISFYLLIDSLTFVPESFKFRYYILLFVLLYVPLAVIVGYWDLKKGTYKVEQTLAKNLSPIWTDLFTQLDQIKINQDLILRHLDISSAN